MRGNLARKREDDQAYQLRGTVVTTERDGVVVSTDTGRVSARRARSCLVEPQPGDVVLLALIAERAYVLAVLEGPEDAPTTITLDGDLAVKLPNGRLSLAAQDGIALTSGADVALTSKEVSVHAGAAHVVLERLGWIAATVLGEVVHSRLVAGTIDRVVERLTERVQRAYRKVEELDQLYAERIDWEARKNLSLHCENALVTADKLVKIDADQVHLG